MTTKEISIFEEISKIKAHNTDLLWKVLFETGNSANDRTAFAFGYLREELNKIPKKRIIQLAEALKECNY